MNEEKAIQKYINTPFAYTRFSKNLSLLQQDIMIKVSKFLQKYVQEYFGSALKESKDIPKPLFSQALKNSGLPEFRLSYAEMGVTSNNFTHVDKAVDEILAITCRRPGIDKETGVPQIVKEVIFTRGQIPLNEASSSVVFRLNPDVVDYVFDMAQGYISHPEDIARISNVERMPMLYYLVRHETQNWKKNTVNLTVFDIKDYLGMIDYDEKEVEISNPDGSTSVSSIRSIVSIQCPKFSRFKERVLIPAIEDIMRLFKEDHIDVVLKYTPKYPGNKTKGDPEYIVFDIFTGEEAARYIEEYMAEKEKTKKTKTTKTGKTEKAAPPSEAVPVRKKRGRPKKVVIEPVLQFEEFETEEKTTPQTDGNFIPDDRVGEWQKIVEEYGEGPLAEVLAHTRCSGTIDGAYSLIAKDYASSRLLSDMDDRLMELLNKYNPDARPKMRVEYGV